MRLLRPFQMMLPYPLLTRAYIMQLSLPALLWGWRHGVCGFEDIVYYCSYATLRRDDDLLLALASLLKEDYSDQGAELLCELLPVVVIDTELAHRSAAHELFEVLFHALRQEASAQVAQQYLLSLASELLFISPVAWTGEPASAPYLHDRGPSDQLIHALIQLRATRHRNKAAADITPEEWEQLLHACQRG